MDVKSRKQYIQALLVRYLKARKKQKGSILSEFCRNTGQNRKYVIRKLAALAAGDAPMPRRRRSSFGRDVQKALKTLWVIFDYPCGQRLAPAIRSELKRLRQFKEIVVSDPTAIQLEIISPATIDRLLRPAKSAWKAGRRYGSASPNLIAKKIPLRMGEWHQAQVGDIDADLVLHCGGSTAGEYGHSLSAMDASTQWWEGDVVMGRARERIFKSIKEIRARFPFPWRSLHCDNDTAFINALLYAYTQEEGLGFSRSRPYRKNDNAYIEQKNFTHVRKPLGYLRYDTAEELAIIRDLYRHELRLYKNFFQPVMKLVRKQREDGRRQRKYDQPQTPYQRLLGSGRLSADQAEELQALYRSLNPADLKRRIDRKLTDLYKLYEKKQKRSLTINPYKKVEPSMVTFLVSEPSSFRLPG